MASIPVINMSSDFREAFFDHGGENAARWFSGWSCSALPAFTFHWSMTPWLPPTAASTMSTSSPTR